MCIKDMCATNQSANQCVRRICLSVSSSFSSFTFVNFSFHLADAAVNLWLVKTRQIRIWNSIMVNCTLTYLTTPSKSAVAPFSNFNFFCRVASIATYQIATLKDKQFWVFRNRKNLIKYLKTYCQHWLKKHYTDDLQYLKDRTLD